MASSRGAAWIANSSEFLTAISTPPRASWPTATRRAAEADPHPEDGVAWEVIRDRTGTLIAKITPGDASLSQRYQPGDTPSWHSSTGSDYADNYSPPTADDSDLTWATIRGFGVDHGIG